MPVAQSSGAGIVHPAVVSYLAELHPVNDRTLLDIRQRGHEDAVPIVNDEVGALLELLVRIHRPRTVVEFGTAIGYSTAWLARGLPKGSQLVSFELDEARHRTATEFLARVETAGTVNLQLGDALELMHEHQGPVDLAFLDASKGEYRSYLGWAIEQMPPGGLVLVDNALMGGHVAGVDGGGSWTESDVAGQQAFNADFVGDPRLDATILPVGDGLGLGVRT